MASLLPSALAASAAFVLLLALAPSSVESRKRLTPTNYWYKVACIAENLQVTLKTATNHIFSPF